ncbi:MAG: type II toxin-antitoxin system RelE/ParE family toxin [Rhodospirillales bacterium]|nr:type II toxin-antitoxin system RelE/ParE family toxin [Rhodospirillales bacterium]
MKNLRWTRPALDDLQEIHAYLAERNPQAAINEIRLVRAQTQNLVTHPNIGRQGRIAGTRELAVAGSSFVIAYRVTKTAIDILAVRHGARAWPEKMD